MIMQRYLKRMAIILAVLLLAPSIARRAVAQQAQQSQQPSYTLPEYNAEQAAAAEKITSTNQEARRVRCAVPTRR